MTDTFNPGDSIFLKASPAVFHGLSGKTTPQERQGPLTVERVYRCGNHMRLKATIDGSDFGYHDGNVTMFEPA